MIKVVLLAPIPNSLYARLVAFAMAKDDGIELAGIIVRSPWNFQRLTSEYNRDGARLFKKIYKKLLVGDQRYENLKMTNLASLAKQWQLPYKSLRTLAVKFNIPYYVFPSHNHPKCLGVLSDMKPDVILFTGGGILRKSLLEIPKLGVLNCHTGILPQFRGMDVVEWTAIEEKVNSVGFGITLHFMDQGLDTGPILIKKRIEPKHGSTFEEIRAELEADMVELMVNGVRNLKVGFPSLEPQKPESGKQYYVMHQRLKAVAETRLDKQI
jgi:methionyl-tRNA formyltransferase